VPFTSFYQALDALEQDRFVFFNPSVEQRLIVIEHEALKLLGKLGCNPKRRDRSRSTFFPISLPNGVSMGVAAKVQFVHILFSVWYSDRASVTPMRKWFLSKP
jgi:hypothetical protein